MTPIRLEDLRLRFNCDGCHEGDVHWTEPLEFEVVSVVTTKGLIAELTKRGVLKRETDGLNSRGFGATSYRLVSDWLSVGESS